MTTIPCDTKCDPPQPWVEIAETDAAGLADAINYYVDHYQNLGPVAEVIRQGDKFHVAIRMFGGSLVITDGSTGGTFRGYFNDTSG